MVPARQPRFRSVRHKAVVRNLLKADSGEHVNENCSPSGFLLPSEELGFKEEKAECERRAGLVACLRCITRRGLQ